MFFSSAVAATRCDAAGRADRRGAKPDWREDRRAGAEHSMVIERVGGELMRVEARVREKSEM